MKNSKTLLYQITETSKYMMGFVIVTREDNAIVIDGGRPEDMPLLKEYIGKRHISAWILTHPHNDHISGFVSECKENRLKDFDIERLIYNFPPYHELIDKTDVPDLEYFRKELCGTLPTFLEIEPMIEDIAYRVKQGESITVDECRIDFIYTYRDGLYSNLMNDASLVFKLTAEEKSVLFLGDLGPDGGDALFEESRHLLKSDIVQMAHHGHMNVGLNVYAEIMPEVCLWCCPDWLYDEPEIPPYLADRARLRAMQRHRMYGTALTRRWMDLIGVKRHYVTKDGTNVIEI